MKRIQCEKGHYYDAERYSVCPHCNKKDDAETESYFVLDQAGKIDKPWIIEDVPNTSDVEEEDATLAMYVQGISGSSGEKTESFFTQKQNEQKQTNEITQRMRNRSDNENDQKTTGYFDSQSAKGHKLTSVAAESEEPQTSSYFTISKSINDKAKNERSNENADAADRSVASRNPDKPNTENKTMHDTTEVLKTTSPKQDTESMFMNQTRMTEPIVGWIVCIKGERFGESFPIGAGKSSIGRSPNNRICIQRDNCISREQHAYIIYEPKSRKFYLQQGYEGKSTGLTYLNDALVLQPMEIKDRDVIGLNESKFLFIPLCNESFSWDAID